MKAFGKTDPGPWRLGLYVVAGLAYLAVVAVVILTIITLIGISGYGGWFSAALVAAIAISLLRSVLSDHAKRRTEQQIFRGLEGESMEGRPWRYLLWWLNTDHPVAGRNLAGWFAVPYWTLLTVIPLFLVLTWLYWLGAAYRLAEVAWRARGYIFGG